MTSHESELRTARTTKAAMGIAASLPALALALLAVLSLASIFAFLRPAAADVGSLLPIDPGDASPWFAVLSATTLGAISYGLLKSKETAWWLAVGTLVTALLYEASTLVRPLGVALVGIPLAVLLADNGRYRVETTATWRRRIVALLITAAVLIALETSLVIAATGGWPRPLSALGDATNALGNSFGLSDDLADKVLKVTSNNVLLALLIVLARLPIVLAAIGVVSPVPEQPADPSTRTRARDIGRRFGRGALLPFQLGDDKFVFSPPDADGMVVYGVVGGSAVALGDPIGPEDEGPGVLAAFMARCRKFGRTPVFYQVSQSCRPMLGDLGYRTFKVGVEAIIQLDDFALTGPSRANLRHTITRCRKAGVSVRWFGAGINPSAEPGLANRLAEIDAFWRSAAGPELGFTIGRFDIHNLRWQPVAVAVDEGGEALGFTTFRPTGSDRGWVLDLMRRGPDSPPGVVEFCIAEAAAAFREAGGTTLSLGLAPLADLDASGPFEERLLAVGARLTGRWYDVKGLAFFKRKFDPTWVPRYGAIRRRRDFVRFVVALLLVHVRLSTLLPRRPVPVREQVAATTR
jgi:phosphatidylglycerol lysyltransferase